MTAVPARRALHTAKWARTMTKWIISFSQKAGARWNIVDFSGARGESRGIVDLLAVRKNHRRSTAATKRGDFLEIILIQCKGVARPGDRPTKMCSAYAKWPRIIAGHLSFLLSGTEVRPHYWSSYEVLDGKRLHRQRYSGELLSCDPFRTRRLTFPCS